MATDRGTRGIEQRPTAHSAVGGNSSADAATNREPEKDEVSRIEPALAPAMRVAALAVTDTACLALAAAAAFVVWAGGRLDQPASIYLPLLPALALVPLLNAATGLYPGFGLGPVEVLRRQWRNSTGVFLALSAATFAFKMPQVYSRMTLALAWLGSIALLPVVRAAAVRILGRRPWWPQPAVIVGSGTRAIVLVHDLQEQRSLGYRPVALLIPGVQPPISEATPRATDVRVGTVEDAPAFAAAGVKVALVSERSDAGHAVAPRLQRAFPHVIVLPDSIGLPVEHVEGRNIGGALAVEYTNQLLRPFNRFLKRSLDLAIGGATLVAALPLIGLAALIVKLSDRGPVFYFQTREGLGGKLILVPKLRTMFTDAEERLRAHLASDPVARREWESRYKLARDPRVIPWVGALLRSTSIDELPQLWSVVRGQMSLVGPRPFPAYHLERFSEEFRALRRLVRPGLSGWWQVTVRSEGGVEEQQAYDTYYIQNWSVWMDAYILLRTPGAILARRGAY
ncbi:MAG: exopolysaccharide biosynthesis polyprenyl glycosylphosphotransferase [Acidobacteriia bacterium]|nr:exopolysaccharide biosynthesis polyprenyl glycosylphosphotransferase [Terriglobia bacterium]